MENLVSVAMTIGAYDEDIVNLNVDTLWRGGIFENTASLSLDVASSHTK
jgi:hypothetical protein